MKVTALAAALFVPAVLAGCGGAGEVSSPTLNSGGHGSVTSISCAAPGECAAGGSYRRGGRQQAFVVSETNGSWGTPIEVPGTAALSDGGNSRVVSISCGAPCDCAAGGYYPRTGRRDPHRAFVVSERNGIWAKAIEVPGTAKVNHGGGAEVDSISCAGAGDCAAGGHYSSSAGWRLFVVDETNGRWGDAIEVPGTPGTRDPFDSPISVSCAAAGDCAAGGSVTNRGNRAFVVDETSGRWGNATMLDFSAS